MLHIDFIQRNPASMWWSAVYPRMGIYSKSGHPLNVYRLDYRAYGLWGQVFCVDAAKHEA